MRREMEAVLKLVMFLLLFSQSAFAWKMEADEVTVSNTTGNTVTHITFRQTFDVVPLVFTLMDDRGGDPSALRVTNVSTTGFDIYTVEPDGQDGPHTNMNSIPYIAIEPGAHTFPDGSKITAGVVQTQKFQSKLIAGDSWEHVSLSGFGTTPIVLGEIQTRANERTDDTVPDAVSQPWITTAVSNVASSGFDIALERSETRNGTLTNSETIAYLVMDSGLNGGDHYFGSNGGDRIEYETIRSADAIQGWDNGDYTISFSKTYDNPMVVSTKNTRDGVDGGWLRRGDIADNHITLQVDEDKAEDSERSHTTERAGLLLFSEPFDAEFDITSDARMVINEVMYNETVTGTGNDEFVEMYVTHAGDLKGYFLSDQDCNQYRFSASCNVSVGDYVIFHTGTGTDSCAGSVKHFYQGTSQYWNNTKDDVLLLRPDHDDRTTTTNTSGCGVNTYQAVPQDYMAYGSNGGAVDDVPTSLGGVTVSWTQSHVTELDNAPDGTSVALTPNATDGDTAACWEFSASGNASNNSCANYIPTRDTNTNAGQTNSITLSNTAMPNMSITKTSIIISDPVNNTSNPKRIPGAIIRYCFTVDNTGDGDAENATVHDSLTGSGRDNLTYIRSGSLVQNISTVCNCAAVTTTNGTISGSDVTINIGDINGTDDTTHSRGCAYIEATID